ncbi:uncharacterized protein LOC113781026 [Coffea eugenioides]|uniref:Uncharacterized protein n=1 Tax=Coffea arabica TaxID=13443 RepID=A0A6P6TT47_COFAR|nr:uncharacterized protein LOC113703983 [Coffea arabica]XP_027182654.1 uncharacterized protein LOC113781026 [Coffea eugenioides]
MQSVVIINKTKSEIVIRVFYRIGDGDGSGCYGSVVYRLKPDGYKLMNPSYFERLSKTMFAPLEIHIFRGGESEFIRFSPLELDFCDGIVVELDDDTDKLAKKFVQRRRVYSHAWIKYWIPHFGIKERIDHILSALSTESAAEPV